MNPAQLQKMMKQAQKLQKEMESEQEKLLEKEYSETMGCGAITIVMTGDKKIKSIDIKEDILDADEKDMIEDMIMSIINNLVDKIETESQEKIGNLTKGLPF